MKEIIVALLGLLEALTRFAEALILAWLAYHELQRQRRKRQRPDMERGREEEGEDDERRPGE